MVKERLDEWLFTREAVWNLAQAYAQWWDAQHHLPRDTRTLSLDDLDQYHPRVRGLLLSRSAAYAHLLSLPPFQLRQAWSHAADVFTRSEQRLEEIVNDELQPRGRIHARIHIANGYYERLPPSLSRAYPGLVGDAPIRLLLSYQTRRHDAWQEPRGFLIISYTLPHDHAVRLEQVQGVRFAKRGFNPFHEHPIRAYARTAIHMLEAITREMGFPEAHVLPACYRRLTHYADLERVRDRLYKLYDLTAREAGYARRVPDGMLVKRLRVPVKNAPRLDRRRVFQHAMV